MKKIQYKSCAKACANIAFIKYWGKKDSYYNIPYNDSISMNLNNCTTTTEVVFDTSFTKDELIVYSFNGEKVTVYDTDKTKRLFHLVHMMQKKKKIKSNVHIVSKNSFPSNAGIASSASSFAALVVATAKALSLSFNERELSRLARFGSGSACRSIPEGFVLWHKGKDDASSYAETLYPPSYWSLSDIVVVLKDSEKKYSSTLGHAASTQSPFFTPRLLQVKKRIEKVKYALKTKNIRLLGKCIEEETRSMHAVALSSIPPLLYWSKETVSVIEYLYAIRKQYLYGYYTIDAGANIHVICHQNQEKEINKRLTKLSFVDYTIVNHPGPKATYIA